MNEQLKKNLGYKLPVDLCRYVLPPRMGGDRDGNLNVTADITRHVLVKPLESHRSVPERHSAFW
ncbi:phosphoenolpyruvate carboxylase [Salmonella enterica subsp. enterica]|nr:phosphoenolpyruvate carboxylase [Salmonella enterica subsp. enterica]